MLKDYDAYDANLGARLKYTACPILSLQVAYLGPSNAMHAYKHVASQTVKG